MATEINQAFVDKYFKDKFIAEAYRPYFVDDYSDYYKSELRGMYYTNNIGICRRLYDALRIHFNGEFPSHLIDMQRPNESLESKMYRKASFRAKTKTTCTRITGSVGKIRRSPDWMIKFPEENKAIPAKESLEKYINQDYPYFKSLTTWLFSVCLKNYLIDSNAVCLVIPLDNPTPENLEFIKPFPFIFNSDRVIDFKEREYAVLESNEKCTYVDGKTTYYNGRVVLIATDTIYVRYKQVNAKGRMEPEPEYVHNIGELPAFKLGGIFKEKYDHSTIWESRISGVVPYLDEFVTMDSDFHAQLVQHVFSEKWVWGMNDECTTCNGMGFMNGVTTDTCTTCNGTKKYKVNIYGVTNVKPANKNLGQQEAPNPPFGYISKESVAEMTKILDELLDKFDLKALSAINMEYLARVPLAESGISKGVDRDESNNIMHSLCEDIVSIADKICYFTNEYRNSSHIENKEKRLELLPQIAVPETYDLLNTSYLLEEMKAAIDGKMNPLFINKMQVEITAKKYPNDPAFIDLLECVFQLDPFVSNTKDEVVVMLQNNLISEKDAVISCNIQSFIKRGIDEKEDFVKLDFDKKMEIINKYAEELITENSVADKILNMPGDPLNDPTKVIEEVKI